MGAASRDNQQKHLSPKADAVKEAAEHLAGFLPGKVMAYGAAHDIQPHIWAAMLAQYRDGDSYVLPAALFDKGHVPRITRVLDRLIRIVSNPEIDPMGENPWQDAAGDSIAGMVMQGVEKPKYKFEKLSEEEPQTFTIAAGTPVTVAGGKASPFRPGPAPCAHCNSRDWEWVNPVMGVCSKCPVKRVQDRQVEFVNVFVHPDTKFAGGGQPHPADTRLWAEGPVHPEEGI